MNVAVIGCGDISDIYIQNCKNKFSNLNIVSCCDIIEERAQQTARKYNIPLIQSLKEILNDNNVDIVLNLTPPKSHYNINKNSLLSGKHVYTEKAMAINFEQAKELVEISKEKNIRTKIKINRIIAKRGLVYVVFQQKESVKYQ
jgi:predicted dehydrogenase